jgi:hypothetical protein
MTDLPLLEPSTGDPAGESPTGTPARRRISRRILFSILAGVVVVLAIVIGVSWHFFNQQSVSLRPPTAVAGFTLDDSADAKQTAEYLRTAVAAKMSLDDSVGAVYRDPASKGHDVLFFGGTRLLLNPAKELDQALGLLNDTSGEVTGLHEVPAGPLGGVMKCGTSTGDGGPMAVCGWADRDSLAMALFPGRTVDQAAALFRDLRTAIEKRS